MQRGGTYLCMEGPAFSTKAESNVYRLGHGRYRHDEPAGSKARARGRDRYVTLAMVTDYDCWHPEHDAVTVSEIIDNLIRMLRMRRKSLRQQWRRCPIHEAASADPR